MPVEARCCIEAELTQMSVVCQHLPRMRFTLFVLQLYYIVLFLLRRFGAIGKITSGDFNTKVILPTRPADCAITVKLQIENKMTVWQKMSAIISLN